MKAFLVVWAVITLNPDGSPREEIPLLRYAFPDMKSCEAILHTVEPAPATDGRVWTTTGCVFIEENKS